MYWQKKNGTALFSCIVPGRRVTYLRLTRPTGTRGRLALTRVRVPGAAPPGGQGGQTAPPPNCRTGEQYYVFAPADFLEAPQPFQEASDKIQNKFQTK